MIFAGVILKAENEQHIHDLNPLTQSFQSFDSMERTQKCEKQYFTVMLFVFQFYPVYNF